MPRGLYVTWVCTVACFVYVHLTLSKNKPTFPSTLTICITFRLHLFYLNPLSSLFFFCFSFSILSLIPKINPVLGDLWKNHLNMTLNSHKRFFCSAFQGLPYVVALQFFGNSVIASRSENSSTVLLHP